ncbi:MAG: hypothetical protein IT373_24785 [Polyangiaceae bacterium]|nr:hypothetical protein [Polyangiaceae bacterium]
MARATLAVRTVAAALALALLPGCGDRSRAGADAGPPTVPSGSQAPPGPGDERLASDLLPPAPPVPGAPAAIPTEHPPEARALAISDDGRLYAAAEAEAIAFYPSWVRIREVATGAVVAQSPLCPPERQLHRFGGVTCDRPDGPVVRALRFAPSGDAVAVACTGCDPGSAGSLRIVDTKTGAVGRVAKLSFEPQGASWGKRGLVVAGTRELVRFDPATGLVDRSFRTRETLEAVSSDGSRYAFFRGRGALSLDGEPPKDFRTTLEHVLLAHDGRYVLVSSVTVERYRLGSDYTDTSIHTGCDADIVLAPNGERLACLRSGSGGTALRIFDFREQRLILERALEPAPAALAVSSSGVVLVAHKNGSVERIAFPPAIQALAVSADGRALALAESEVGESGQVILRVRDAETRRAAYESERLPGRITALAFAPDASRLAAAFVAGDAGTILIVRREPGARPERVPVALRAPRLAWGSDRIVAAEGRTVLVVDPGAGKLERTVEAKQPVESLAADASAYATREQAGAYERGTPQNHEWVQPPARVERVAVADGASRLLFPAVQGSVTLLPDGGALLVEPRGLSRVDASGTQLRRIEQDFLGHLFTSTDGRFAAHVDGNYFLRSFDLATGKELAREWLQQRPSAVAVSNDGVSYVARPGTEVLRVAPRP